MHVFATIMMLTESSPWFTQMMWLTKEVKECYN